MATKTGFLIQRLLDKDQSGPRLWRNALLLDYAFAQGSIGAIVQTNVESITENFENIGAVVSSKLIDKDIQRHQAKYCISNCYWISNDHNVFEGYVNNASCYIWSKRSWFESYQLC